MYRVLHTGRDKICGIKQESFPCMRILMSFVYQADVEAGDSLNMPANIPADIKAICSPNIAKEHPDAYPSTRLLLEATILSKMQEDNDVVIFHSSPCIKRKEKERKGEAFVRISTVHLMILRSVDEFLLLLGMKNFLFVAFG